MPNNYFRFKQFTVQQDRSVMKVCTDSCILGAWTALQLEHEKTVLDIGTGTGLLALMLAQNAACTIDAIESDPESAGQAVENIRQSPWSDRIHVVEEDVQTYRATSRYDFIITNPPFFESDLHSPEIKKNKAKHDTALTLEQLVTVMSSLLKPDGRFSILLPEHRTHYFEKLAGENRFMLHKKLTIRQSPAHPSFRSICLFGYQQPTEPLSDHMTIKNNEENYSEEFIKLMKAYYLNF